MLDAAREWIDANQLGRRNLTPDAFRLLLGRRYNRTKKKQGTNNQHVQASSEKGQSDTFHTADKLADQYAVSAERRAKEDGISLSLNDKDTKPRNTQQAARGFVIK